MHSSVENEKGESHRRPSRSSSAESDDFSLWSDTGDLAEQLANAEDPLRIELDPLTREGQSIKTQRHGQGGGRRKRVDFHPDHLEKNHSAGGIEKENIYIPVPPPRHIGKIERLLALAMAPNDPQTARSKGLVGKPLL